MTRSYREDIDWLRAIAVLSVIGFHWDIEPFHGAGFVGVDIFFVISGFLITQIIQSEMASGGFSFARFYERRVRRLLPALYAMVVMIVVPSFYFLLPSERHEFFKSIAAVVTFTSNFFFWMQTGYFDHSADEKLLLHTWSLSAEEQFYLVLPLLVWALLRWHGHASNQLKLAIGLGTVALASFGLTYWLMKNTQTPAAFFMSPPRAWEFFAGSLVAVEGLPFFRNRHFQHIGRAVGFGMIVTAVVIYRSYTIFPGVTALLPCAGAAIYIWSGLGSPSRARSPYSPFSLVSFFGRISYSLYLWHWPLLIFAKFSKVNLTLSLVEKLELFVFATILSYASYLFVEQPLRRGVLVSTRRAAFALAGSASLFLVVGSLVGIFAGDRSSTQDQRARQLNSYFHYALGPVYRQDICFTMTAKSFDDKTCLTMVPGKTNIMLWGDSHAAHYFYGLRAGTDADRVNIMQATAAGCLSVFDTNRSEECKSLGHRVAAFIARQKPDLVVISSDWFAYSNNKKFGSVPDAIRQSVSEINKHGIPVALIGPTILYRSRLPPMILRAELRNIPLSEDIVVPQIFQLDAEIKAALPPGNGNKFVSVLDAACPNRVCPAMVNGLPLTFDDSHLTAEGSVYVSAFIVKALGLPENPAK